MERTRGNISERIADVKKGIDELEKQKREQLRPGCIVNADLSIIEGESDVGQKRELLGALFAIVRTKGIKERDVVEIIKFQSRDLALLTLVDEVVGNEE